MMLISRKASRSTSLIYTLYAQPARKANVDQAIGDGARSIADSNDQGVVTNLVRQHTNPIHSRINGFELSCTENPTVSHPRKARTWTRVNTERQISDNTTLGNESQCAINVRFE
tara:strand:- start:253 stop:594 length:342 start_codon:yes stop_codon:yes gene_type:complete